MARVLIVDDEDVLVEMLSTLIEDLGHEPMAAVNGRTALAKLKDAPDPPVLIITDVMMPQMNGIEFSRALRTDPFYKDIPIILMSAAGRPKDANVADYFVPKPFDVDDLSELIQKCINHSSRSAA